MDTFSGYHPLINFYLFCDRHRAVDVLYASGIFSVIADRLGELFHLSEREKNRKGVPVRCCRSVSWRQLLTRCSHAGATMLFT